MDIMPLSREIEFLFITIKYYRHTISITVHVIEIQKKELFYRRKSSNHLRKVTINIK